MEIKFRKIISLIERFANRFSSDDPLRLCGLFKEKGCSHIDGPLCDFPNCRMYSAYEKVHEMHNHPMTEEKDGIPKDKVIVDEQFRSLYTKFDWYYRNHIVVYRSDYEALKHKK